MTVADDFDYDTISDDELMERVTASRAIMERTRAAVCLLNSSGGTKSREMAAFLSLFHPDMPEAEQRSLVNSVDNMGSRRR